MIIAFRPLRDMKASSSIPVIVLGIVVMFDPMTSSLVELLIMALQPFLLSKVVLSLSTEILSSLAQFSNMLLSKIVRDFPIRTDVRFSQFAKAYSLIFVTLFGITIEAKASQLPNAFSPMLVTESGMVIVASSTHSWKVSFSILLIP